MPADCILVDRVDYSPTGDQQPRWLVSGTYASGKVGFFQAHTLTPIRAALCERAGKQQLPLLVLWKDARHGFRDIVEVKLADAEVA